MKLARLRKERQHWQAKIVQEQAGMESMPGVGSVVWPMAYKTSELETITKGKGHKPSRYRRKN
jgi:hypothetical protein